MTVATASTVARLKKAKHHEIAVRYRYGKKPMAILRCAHVDRWLNHVYGDVLPDDDAGRADCRIMAHHLARRSGDPVIRIAGWIANRAPWMSETERGVLIAAVIAKPIKWKADTLGKLLGVTAALRTELKIYTIGACDQTSAERAACRKTGKRKAKREKRRDQGIMPRAEYLSASTEHKKPWLAEGISRRTWYRRQSRAPE